MEGITPGELQDEVNKANLQSACAAKRASALTTTVFFPFALQLD